jgi:glycosyltransferase involved in cell wall biosynthesis
MHGLFSELARSQAVSVLSLVNPNNPREVSPEATRRYCEKVFTVPNPALALAGVAKRMLQARSLASWRSFEWRSHVVPALLRELRALLARERYDVVTFEFSHMAPYRRWLPKERAAPVFVLDEHNIEYQILQRTAAAESGLPRRLYNGINMRKLRREERHAWRAFDGCTVTSAHDEELLLRDAPSAATAVIPNAVDLEFFRPRAEAPVPNTILFFGALNYFPNADGLQYFLSKCMPLLKKTLPAAKLRVVGHTPQSFQSLGSESVEMVGFVDDVRVELSRAAAVIAPLRVGGGTRLKILEAMAMGKPVISTQLGAEGLQVVPERDLLIADEPAAFAAAIARALSDKALGLALGAAARRLVEDSYGWEAAVGRLERFHDRLLDARTQPRS